MVALTCFQLPTYPRLPLTPTCLPTPYRLNPRQGVGTTGALGAGAPPKIFTLHMYVTQSTICWRDRLLRVCHKHWNVSRSLFPGLNNNCWLQNQKNIIDCGL